MYTITFCQYCIIMLNVVELEISNIISASIQCSLSEEI